MAYEILMPVLSDSMDEGKLISWQVKVDDDVHIGDVIAEVESDKAIMEVQCFKNGKIEALYISEGESALVGTVIASVKLSESTSVELEDKTPKDLEKEFSLKAKDKDIKSLHLSEQGHILSRSFASPKAKILAQTQGLDIEALQKQNKLPSPAHEKDIFHYQQKRFFTPRALRLIENYKLDTNDFDLSKKYDSVDVQEYINEKQLSRFKPIDSFQKSLMKNLEKSFQKPVYHIFDHIDSSHFYSYGPYSISAWLVKVFATAMMDFEEFRSCIDNDGIRIYANASISFAMTNDKKLYMPVIKEANLLNIKEIGQSLKDLQDEINKKSLKIAQMQGSSFGLSNLGITGIEAFEALINQDDSGIAAIGAEINKKISVSLTIDHRLINGYEAALFMQKVKALCADEEFFKRNVEDV